MRAGCSEAEWAPHEMELCGYQGRIACRVCERVWVPLDEVHSMEERSGALERDLEDARRLSSELIAQVAEALK